MHKQFQKSRSIPKKNAFVILEKASFDDIKNQNLIFTILVLVPVRCNELAKPIAATFDKMTELSTKDVFISKYL